MHDISQEASSLLRSNQIDCTSFSTVQPVSAIPQSAEPYDPSLNIRAKQKVLLEFAHQQVLSTLQFMALCNIVQHSLKVCSVASGIYGMVVLSKS